MLSDRVDLAEILRNIDIHKHEIVKLVKSGRPMTDPEVVTLSQKLDRCLNIFYRLCMTANIQS